MTASKGSKDDVDAVRTAIAKLTGRLPVSRDPEYLERRLAGLRRRKLDGDRAVNDRYGDPNTVMSVSMHSAAKDAVVRMAGGEQVAVSELVRRALAEYAAKHGYGAEIAHFGEAA